MTYRDRDDKPTHPMIEAFAAEFTRSAEQWNRNRHFLMEAGKRVESDHYVGVRITTMSGAVRVGRIFEFFPDAEVLELVTSNLDVRRFIDATDIVIISVASIESIEITEAFDNTFEVTFSRDDLNEILNRLKPTDLGPDLAADADYTDVLVKSLDEVLGERHATPGRDSLIEARRFWNHFKARHHLTSGRRFPSNGYIQGPAHLNDSGVSEWYRSLIERDHDGVHVGEAIFRVLADGMPSDYLFADTRTAVETAYRRHVG